MWNEVNELWKDLKWFLIHQYWIVGVKSCSHQEMYEYIFFFKTCPPFYYLKPLDMNCNCEDTLLGVCSEKYLTSNSRCPGHLCFLPQELFWLIYPVKVKISMSRDTCLKNRNFYLRLSRALGMKNRTYRIYCVLIGRNKSWGVHEQNGPLKSMILTWGAE